jgi:hypothetical protein
VINMHDSIHVESRRLSAITQYVDDMSMEIDRAHLRLLARPSSLREARDQSFAGAWISSTGGAGRRLTRGVARAPG